MPCRDDYAEELCRKEAAQKQKDRIDSLARMLCFVMTNVTNLLELCPDGNEKKELKKWWAEHQKKDKAYKEALAKQANKKALAKQANKKALAESAIKKLTEEERKALGL